MKKLLLIAILTGIFSFSHAQEFEPTTTYKVVVNKTHKSQEFTTLKAALKTGGDTSITLTHFPIEAVEFIEKTQVFELSTPGLDGISKVLKVEMHYVEYCSYVVSTYILVTEPGDFISLPMLTNTLCNDTTSEVRYLFPNQPFGKKNQIVRSNVLLSSNNWVSSATTQQTISWNDDDFGSSGLIPENY